MGGNPYQGASQAGASFVQRVREARRIAQPAECNSSITDGPYRAVSIFPSLLLARFGIAPNVITIASGVLGLAGVVALGWRNYAVRLTGALLLQASYLFDFVDGEVARLLHRISKRGFFIDLICHGLIKSSLFLAVGYGVYGYNHRAWALVLAFVACIAVSSIHSLPFLVQAAKVIDERAPDGVLRSTTSTITLVRNLLATFPESPGIYGLVLLGALFDRLSWVVALYAILAPIWFLRKVIRFR
jgi:phosphatidylglycerophosphate synthase